ncbi:hypothetical protein Ccrd_015718, partial [Cynara cardunculus var. scolymus]
SFPPTNQKLLHSHITSRGCFYNALNISLFLLNQIQICEELYKSTDTTPITRHSNQKGYISNPSFVIMSSRGSSFLNNSLSGVSRMTKSQSLRVSIHPPMVVAMMNPNTRPDRNVAVSVESAVKEVNAPMAVEIVECKSKQNATVVDDVGYSLLRNPHHNKGLAFTEKERDAHYIRGLLPPVVVNQNLQVKKMMNNIRQYDVPLHKYQAMMDLQERNERLFYKLLIDNVEELLPIVYTPTVGEACQKYGSIFKQPQGLFISLKDKGRILEILKNWPEKKIQVIVVTDGERILGLGDLGCQEYAELMNEFMSAVKQNYGEKVLIQFEDFANHNAFDLLAKYSATHLVFNDDIQGTASVVLAGLISALKLTRAPLEESRKKKPWSHEHEPVKELLDAVKAIKPTVLIGSSGAGQTFTKEVVEAMSSLNKKPVILALSNPTSQSECTAEQAYTWSEGRAIFASGSPFAPVEYNGKVYVSGQSNNAYIFPGFGLGLIISGAIRVHDDMLLAAWMV